jgi:hypothetical protein
MLKRMQLVIAIVIGGGIDLCCLPYKLPYLCHQALMLRVLRYSPKPVANITNKRQISEAIPRDERPNALNDPPNEAPWRRLNRHNKRRGMP